MSLFGFFSFFLYVNQVNLQHVLQPKRERRRKGGGDRWARRGGRERPTDKKKDRRTDKPDNGQKDKEIQRPRGKQCKPRGT